MARDVKVSVLEIDGVEIEGPEEHILLAESIPFNPANSDELSDDRLQEAVTSLANRHFGKKYDIARFNPNFQTTSGTFETALSIDMGLIPAGTYRIGWSYRSYNSKSNTENETQVAFNGLAVITNSVSGQVGTFGGGLGEQFNGFAEFTVLETNVIISVDIRRTAGNGGSRANSINLEVWRLQE